MITHAINKQVFELNCPDERTAMAVQKQLLYYAGPAIESIIAAVLDEMGGEEVVQIDRLQVDLRDLVEEEFGSPQMLERFGVLLREQYAGLVDGVQQKDIGGSMGGSLPGAEWEMVRLFLLSGDIPWWADKSGLPDIDELLKKLVIERPEELRAFFESQPADAVVWKRVYWQCKGDTRKLVEDLLSGEGRARLREVLRARGGVFLREEPPLRVRGASQGETGQSMRAKGAPVAMRAKDAGEGMESMEKMERREKMGGREAMEIGESMEGGEVSEIGESMEAGKVTEAGELRGTNEAAKTYEATETGGVMEAGETLLSKKLFQAKKNSALHAIAPDVRLSNLVKSFRRKKTVYGETYHSWAISRLAKGIYKGMYLRWAHFLGLTGWFRDEDLLYLGSLMIPGNEKAGGSENMRGNENALRSENTRGNKIVRGNEKEICGKIREILSTLSIFQLAFLVQRINRNEKRDATTSWDVTEKNAVALAVIKHLGVKGGALYDELMGWPDRALLSLLKKWDSVVKGQENLKQIRKGLLQTGAGNAGIRGESRAGLSEERISHLILSVLPVNDLTASETRLLEDILHQRPFGTAYQKTMAARLLRKLPEAAIRLLDHLRRLPEEEWMGLLPSDGPNTTITDKEQNGEDGQRMLVENAGLCLFAPYLDLFFSNLGYLDKGRFKSAGHVCKGIFLLHYIVTGQCKAPEYLLSLNKLFCGIPPGTPVPREVRISKKERREADDLIRSVITNWTSLKNTSAEGLRGSFLCRKGIIRDHGAYLVLQVERKEYDILLNGVSWGYSIIKLPWMKKHIQVEW